jgi:hypothetical protein
VPLDPDTNIQHLKARCSHSLSDVFNTLGKQGKDPLPRALDIGLLLDNIFHDFLLFLLSA